MTPLSDAALQDFIIRGYRVVQPTATADLHGELHRQVERVLATGNPGNGLIDRIPLLHQLFADPAVDAALTGILGPKYALCRHCHCHDLAPGNQAQNWHKDYPFGGNVRYHRPRYVLMLYYPHEVTPDMGPTALVPRTQYYMDGPGDEVEGLALTCAAGTVVITHYELWHRATANRSTQTRYMLKFLFTRTEERVPEQRSRWMPTGRHAALYRTLWRWYGGQAPALRPRRSVEALQAALRDPDERVRIDAYYDLGALGVEGVPVLMAALKDESARRWQANIGRGDFTNPSQLESPYGLAAAGTVAVPALEGVVGHENVARPHGLAVAAHDRAHLRREGAGEEGDAVGLHDELAVGVAKAAGEVEHLVDHGAHGGLGDDDAHLVGKREQLAADDLARDRIGAGLVIGCGHGVSRRAQAASRSSIRVPHQPSSRLRQ